MRFSGLAHLVPLPQLGELRRGLGQPGHQALPGRLGQVLGHRRAVLGDHAPGAFLPVEDAGPAPLAGEHPPQRVPLLERHVGQVAHQRPRRRSSRRGCRTWRCGCRPGTASSWSSRACAVGGSALHSAWPFPSWRVGEPEQVLALVRIEQQRPRDRVQHLRRGVDVAALLQPGVPGDADAGERGDLLAAQAGRTAPGGRAAGRPAAGAIRSRRLRRKPASSCLRSAASCRRSALVGKLSVPRRSVLDEGAVLTSVLESLSSACWLMGTIMPCHLCGCQVLLLPV